MITLINSKRSSTMKMETLIKDLKEETISFDDVSDLHRYQLIIHFLNQCKVEDSQFVIGQLDDWLFEFEVELPEFEEKYINNSITIRKEDYGIVNN